MCDVNDDEDLICQVFNHRTLQSLDFESDHGEKDGHETVSKCTLQTIQVNAERLEKYSYDVMQKNTLYIREGRCSIW